MTTKMVILAKVKELPKKVEFRGRKESKIVLSVKRNFQNSDGDFIWDTMEVLLWRGIADYINGVVKVGEDIQIIGRCEKDKNNDIVLFGEQVDLIR